MEKEFEIYSYVKEDTQYYELVIAETNTDKSSYNVITRIDFTKKELENLSQIINQYLENK